MTRAEGTVEAELRALRSAVWRIVNECDGLDYVTTEGGDRFLLTPDEAGAVRQALAANEPGAEGSHD